MVRTRTRAVVALVALLAAVGLGACREDGGASARPTVTAREYKFEGADEFEAGVVTLTLSNEGKLKHEALLLRIGDTPVAQVLREFDPVVDGGPMAPYLGYNGGVAGTPADRRNSLRFEVRPGRYLLVCTLTDADSQPGGGGAQTESLPKHYKRGMARVITVTGEAEETLKAEGPTITARDYTFDTSGLRPGDNQIVFRNDGPAEPHHVAILGFAPGTTEAAAAGIFQTFANLAPGSPPPPGTPEPAEVAANEPFDPGGVGTLVARLEAGRTYVLACFIADRGGGPPHAFVHQMVKAITIR